MYSVGSMVAIQEGLFMVCGYRPIDLGDSVGMGYLLVPYPFGAVNGDSFSLVSADVDLPVVFQGYQDDVTASYDGLLEQMRSYGREVTMEDVLAVIDEARDELESDVVAAREDVGHD